MTSLTTTQFRALFRKLPEEVRAEGRKAYKLFKDNPRHPSLQFKKLLGQMWSVRISLNYRVVGVMDGETIIWFWAGSHADYDKLVARLRSQ